MDKNTDRVIFEIKQMIDEKLADFSNFEKMVVMQAVGDLYNRFYTTEVLATANKTFLFNMKR